MQVREIFSNQQKEIVENLEAISNYYETQRYLLLEYLKESEIDSYLGIHFLQIFFQMQSLSFLRKEFLQ